jgi:hypothetical protein
MAEKLVYIKPNEIKEAVMAMGWLKDFGSYNRIPQPFIKIEDITFAEIAKRGTPDYIEHRMLAIIEGDADIYVPSVIYWYNDTGLMVVFDESNLMEFYQLGCQHDYEEIPADKGRIDLTCKICGYKDVIYNEPENMNEEIKE